MLLNEERATQASNEETNLSLQESVLVEPIYNIQKIFVSFSHMIVLKNRNDSQDKSWRKHLSTVEKKRFQRLARIIKAFQKILSQGTAMNVAEAKFKEYYRNNKKSFAMLSDRFSKKILDNN